MSTDIYYDPNGEDVCIEVDALNKSFEVCDHSSVVHIYFDSEILNSSIALALRDGLGNKWPFVDAPPSNEEDEVSITMGIGVSLCSRFGKCECGNDVASDVDLVIKAPIGTVVSLEVRPSVMRCFRRWFFSIVDKLHDAQGVPLPYEKVHPAASSVLPCVEPVTPPMTPAPLVAPGAPRKSARLARKRLYAKRDLE